ncbi:hypothetical protein IE53DRAFT_186975 [Violaceomyces palustris]|uniref:Uncharacterized protein n=1 Tax=Violaceomyces palustris TaxID=1673888 RepID=A0ACD0NS14_9BASI|nr:hypothetical protein IE53DRAFT_186975 [Violaceomyces palustris]
MSQIALEPQETTTKSELNGWKHPVLPPSDVYTPGVSPIKKEFLLPHKFRSQLNDAADRQKDPSSKLGSNAAAGDQPPSTPVEPAQDQQGGGQKRKEGEGEGEQEEASQQQQQQQQQQPVVKLKGAARRRAKREAAAAAEKEGRGQDGKRKKQKGQNKGRTFQRVGDAVQICHSFAVEGRCKFVGGPQRCVLRATRPLFFLLPNLAS